MDPRLFHGLMYLALVFLWGGDWVECVLGWRHWGSSDAPEQFPVQALNICTITLSLAGHPSTQQNLD